MRSLCSRFLSLLLSRRSRLGSDIRLGLSLNRATDFGCDIFRDGAGVSLLLRYAEAGQKVNDRLGLDFQLAGQLVDAYLIGFGHALRSVRLLNSSWQIVLRIRFFRLFRLGRRFRSCFEFRRGFRRRSF